ncbi:hypothetical protein PMSD_02035 [Paenibacillus macquariensis subsp. defensor]|nr:hypothetical protein PMSD_02035 [Paenibacillus macquariensis subsp. defensor]
MSKRDFSSMQTNTPESQANNAVDRLHQSITQAVSHPTEELVDQAQNSLIHAEHAVQALQGSENGLAAEQTEAWLAEEKSRLAAVSVSEAND